MIDALSVGLLGLENGELIALVMFGGAGVVAIWWGAVNFRDGYQMWSHEPVNAGAVASETGVVEVTGTARPMEETVVAPYSEQECLAHEYRTKVQRNDVGGGDDTSEWRTVESGSESVPFLLEDGSGSVAVDPDGAELSMDERDHSSSMHRRQIESRLDAGETVHVFGHRRDDGALADQSVYVGDGDEANYRIADTSGGRAVARLLAKGAGAIVFGALFVGIAGYVVTTA